MLQWIVKKEETLRDVTYARKRQIQIHIRPEVSSEINEMLILKYHSQIEMGSEIIFSKD